MSTAGLILEEAIPETLELLNPVEFPMEQPSVALCRDEKPATNFVAVTPEAVQSLTDAQIKVWMQHDFGARSGFEDMAYANAGAEFEDDFTLLAGMARVILQQTPFTEEQLAILHSNQRLVSFQNSTSITTNMLTLMRQKTISALAFDLLLDNDKNPVLEQLALQSNSSEALSISVSNFVLPLLTELITTPRLRFVLQKNPNLMPCVYCIDGIPCNATLSERLHQPYRDIVSLCWGLN